MDEIQKPAQVELEEQKATITFDIPAYIDKNTGMVFHREVKVSSKKAYMFYKRSIEKFEQKEEK